MKECEERRGERKKGTIKFPQWIFRLGTFNRKHIVDNVKLSKSVIFANSQPCLIFKILWCKNMQYICSIGDVVTLLRLIAVIQAQIRFCCAKIAIWKHFVCCFLHGISTICQSAKYILELYICIQIQINQLLIFIEKFLPLPEFEPRTSRVTSRCVTNWAFLA